MLLKVSLLLLASAFERVDGQFLPSSWGRGVRHRHHVSYPRLRVDRRYILVRGGSVDIDDPDESGDDDYAQGFISSFESELAEIRKEAERDAESELLKLLDLIQRRGVEEDDYDGDDATALEDNSDDVEDGDGVIEGDSETVMDQSFADDVTSPTTSVSITETSASPGGQESDVSSGNDERVLFPEANLFVGLDEDDETEPPGPQPSDSSDSVKAELEDSKENKAKRRKKGKSKSSKKMKKRKQESVSVTATTTLLDGEQIKQRKGVMFYLRSDVGRALTLFIATVILALLTKHMERQMNEEQNNVK